MTNRNTYLAGPNGNPGYNLDGTLCSFNHLPLGAVGEWIWKVIGGINLDDSNPGFKNIIIKPEPGGGITNAFASFNSIRGPVVCSWTNDIANTNYYLNITVPPAAIATVFFPSNTLANITENGLVNGYVATNAPGVLTNYFTSYPSWPKGAVVFQVGAGSYKFKSSGANP